MRSIAFLLPALGALAAPAMAAGDADVPDAEVAAAARAFDDAQLHGDRAVLERMLAPDFLLVRGSGRVGDRRDFIAGFTDPAGHIDALDITDRLLLRITPDVAVVGGEARVRGTDGGKPFAEHFRYSDTFVRRDGRWLVAYTQVTGLPRP